MSSKLTSVLKTPSSALPIRCSQSFRSGEHNGATGQQDCTCQAAYQLTLNVSLAPHSSAVLLKASLQEPEVQSFRGGGRLGEGRSSTISSAHRRALGLPGPSISEFQHTPQPPPWEDGLFSFVHLPQWKGKTKHLSTEFYELKIKGALGLGRMVN